MIDPLLRKKKDHTELAESWSDDPWDLPSALGKAMDVESDVVKAELRHFSRPLGLAVFIVAAVSLLFGAVGLWYLHEVNPSGGTGIEATFTVNEGDSIATISGRLRDEGFITNASVFRWYVARKGGVDLVPGYYQITPKSHMGDIMARLKVPPSATFTKVTFPEGFVITQMAERLAEKTKRLSAEQFIASANDPNIVSQYRPPAVSTLEGLLFPDTYQVSGDENEAQVVQRMVALLERVARQVGLDDSQKLVGVSPYRALIVASMIEREAKVGDDRAKIARVIYNRLEIGMKLQIDATLYYNAPADASFTDLKALDTPYNTYLYKGLPPTPIASPGRASIEAALNPAPNPSSGDPICAGAPKPCRYLYYVLSDADGGHAFAATLAQHEANVATAKAAGLLP
jgi:UPF0755 protein